MTPRLASARILAELLRERGSLASQLPSWQSKVADADRALVQQLCYGTARHYPRLALILRRLLEKPLRAKDADVQALLLLGLYQLDYTRIPDHAAIGETAGAARALKKPWATGLINGVLRRYQREREQVHQRLGGDPQFQTAHPRWLLERLQKAWPDKWRAVVAANNAHPPLTLRLAAGQQTRRDYLESLRAAAIEAHPCPFSDCGCTLDTPLDPTTLPGFAAGSVSVQDEAAQLAAGLLELGPGHRVLDACSAPGGKTGHILQSEPDLDEVVALDLEPRRLERVRENLNRLGVKARVQAGDATDPERWWDGKPFDRILLDAPCSATGIIRRQSDVKMLRREKDIERLSALQAKLLDALWPLLSPGGLLLYATCSVMPEENTDVVEAFVARTNDARLIPIEAPWGMAQPAGRQLLPSETGHDGFYYAKLEKIAK